MADQTTGTAATGPRKAGGWFIGWGASLILVGFCLISGGVWRIMIGRAIRSGSAAS